MLEGRRAKKWAAACTLIAGVWLLPFFASCQALTWWKPPAQIASEALREAESLRSLQDEQAGRKAVIYYERASAAWLQAGDRRAAAAALIAIGDLHVQWGEGREALPFYQRSLDLAQTAGARLEQTASLNGLSATHLLQGDHKQARQWAERALELAQQYSEGREIARALMNRGDCSYATGNRPESLPDYQHAGELFESLQDSKGYSLALLQQGAVLNETQEAERGYNEALALYQRALSLRVKDADVHGQALALVSLGHLYAGKGNGRQARRYYEEAEPLLKRSGDKVWQAAQLLGMGKIYADMRRDEWALPCVEKALAIFREIHHLPYEASTSLTLGRRLLALGKTNEALEKFEQAERIATSLNEEKTLNLIWRQQGVVHSEKGDWEKAFAFFERASQAHRKNNESPQLSLTLNLMGQAYLKANNYPLAQQKFKDGQALIKGSKNYLQQAEFCYGLARVELAKGQLARAAALSRQAIDWAELQRQTSDSAALRTTYFEQAQNYFELYIDLLVKQGKFQQAVEVSEQSRAREFNALLRESEVELPTDQQAVAQQKQLLDEIDQRMRSLPKGTAQSAAAENELQRLRAQRDELISERAARQVWHAPTAIRLSEIQQHLAADTALLEFALGKERSHLWVITRTGLQHQDLPPRASIESAVSRTLESLQKVSQTDDWTAAAELGSMLLKSVEANLAGKRLLVVPAGALHAVPFEALPLSVVQQGKPAWLIERHEITYLPSAATLPIASQLLKKRTPPPNQIAVLADAIYALTDKRVTPSPTVKKQAEDLELAASSRYRNDQPVLARLHYAKEEAEFIGSLPSAQPSRLWVGESANLAVAKSPDLATYRILHLAAHGKVMRETPELSAVIFSQYDRQGIRQDAELRVADIYNLRFKADLVVLSACDTALGKDWRGEGVEGLSRAFMHAGAARVMASLWKVDDEATAELMKRFYANHFNGSMPIARALRQAQLSLMTEPKWNHPAYWAGFVLQSGVQ